LLHDAPIPGAQLSRETETTMDNAKITARFRHYDTLVIGASQAGLAAGYYLKRAGLRFALLDAADEIGAAWSSRWDSLRLFTPARYDALPGMPFPGEPYSLPTKDDVAAYLKAYAQRFDLPVRLRTSVRSLRVEDARYVVAAASGESFTARSVIVATGANQQPYVPAFAGGLHPRLVQMHSSAYRRPSQLPEGGVLLVGAGNSGAQIALELAQSGRKVVLSGPDTGSMPRRFLGRVHDHASARGHGGRPPPYAGPALCGRPADRHVGEVPRAPWPRARRQDHRRARRRPCAR
jgi:putative flavoprotein involved in K+ transport